MDQKVLDEIFNGATTATPSEMATWGRDTIRQLVSKVEKLAQALDGRRNEAERLRIMNQRMLEQIVRIEEAKDGQQYPIGKGIK